MPPTADEPCSGDGPCSGGDQHAEPHDPGLQAERTRLAWRRTVLAATVCALLLLRLGVQDRLTPLTAIALGLTAVCWVCLLLVTQRRIHALSRRPPVPVSRLITLTALACTGLGMFGMLLILA